MFTSFFILIWLLVTAVNLYRVYLYFYICLVQLLGLDKNGLWFSIYIYNLYQIVETLYYLIQMIKTPARNLQLEINLCRIKSLIHSELSFKN